MQQEDKDTLWMEKYVRSITITPDDSIVLLHWNWRGLEQFMKYVNPAYPTAMNNMPASILINTIGAACNPSTIVQDISNFIRQQVGQNRFQQQEALSGLVIINNNASECIQLGKVLDKIENDPLIKSVLEHHLALRIPKIQFGSLNIITEGVKVLNSEILDPDPNNPLCPFN